MKLDVLICTYGKEGMARVASCRHPQVAGVRYLVCWQQPDGGRVPPEIAGRADFEVHEFADRGLSRNRNHCLELAEAPLSLISDDDVEYEADELLGVIDAFAERPGVDMIFFKYHSSGHEKRYFDYEFDLRHAPRFYYYCSFEIAFRTVAIKDRVWFDERFGINGEFIAGEEDMFLLESRRKGVVTHFVPQYVCRHDGATTSEREGESDGMLMVKGAVLRRYHRFSFWLRIMVHGFRRSDRSRGWFRYVAVCMRGAWKV